jgi:hypothetical protein
MTLFTQENDTRRIVGFHDSSDTICLDCVDVFRLDVDTFTDLYLRKPLEYTCVYCGVQFPTEDEMN